MFSWSRTILISTLFLCFAIGGVAQSPAGQDVEVIRTDTDLTNLLFVATDKNNRYITTLQQTDVRVLEDNVPQTLFTFQRETDRPLAIAFLIDVSSSERDTLPDEKAAARSFIESVIRSEKDQAAIIPFEGYAHLERALTREVLSLYLALEGVEIADPAYPGSGKRLSSGIVSGPGTMAPPEEGTTAIWEAIIATSREVLARSQGQRRRAIIMLTDGRDTSSRISREAAINSALETETVIYVIGIGDSRDGGVQKDTLKTVAERTGGRAFFPKKESDLKAAFADIEQELRAEYLVAYSSTNKSRDGAFRRLRIEITNPELVTEKLKLRYRPGYFAKKQ